MKEERPILFNTPMVQAILKGRKTQTRRIVKETKIHAHCNGESYFEIYDSVKGDILKDIEDLKYYCPYGQPGDLLWVREKFAWTVGEHEPFDTLSFFADNFHRDVKRPGVDYPDEEMCQDGWHDEQLALELKWKPSIHMPKAFARIWLKVKDVRVERVQDISEEDILKEGIRIPVNRETGNVVVRLGEENSALSFLPGKSINTKYTQSQLLFAHWAELWCDVNGRENWDANPWVWAITFEELSRTGRPEPETCNVEPETKEP